MLFILMPKHTLVQILAENFLPVSSYRTKKALADVNPPDYLLSGLSAHFDLSGCSSDNFTASQVLLTPGLTLPVFPHDLATQLPTDGRTEKSDRPTGKKKTQQMDQNPNGKIMTDSD
jgi:hypothetical protein